MVHHPSGRFVAFIDRIFSNDRDVKRRATKMSLLYAIVEDHDISYVFVFSLSTNSEHFLVQNRSASCRVVPNFLLFSSVCVVWFFGGFLIDVDNE